MALYSIYSTKVRILLYVQNWLKILKILMQNLKNNYPDLEHAHTGRYLNIDRNDGKNWYFNSAFTPVGLSVVLYAV